MHSYYIRLTLAKRISPVKAEYHRRAKSLAAMGILPKKALAIASAIFGADDRT